MAEDRIMQRYEEQLPVDGLDASLKVSTHVLVYLLLCAFQYKCTLASLALSLPLPTQTYIHMCIRIYLYFHVLTSCMSRHIHICLCECRAGVPLRTLTVFFLFNSLPVRWDGAGKDPRWRESRRCWSWDSKLNTSICWTLPRLMMFPGPLYGFLLFS